MSNDNRYEYKFLVFSVLNGPKNMIDNLNAEGEEGWCAYDNLPIGSERVVTFLRRQKVVKVADPKKDKEKTISDLWTGGSDE